MNGEGHLLELYGFGRQRAIVQVVNGLMQQNQRVAGRILQIFPVLFQKILPVTVVVTALAGCQNDAVEANSARNPVVAPAGTVLRVRLNDTLESGRSRPGDRFSGMLDSAVVSGSTEVLPKGTLVEGYVVASKEPGRYDNRAVLAVKLENFQVAGNRYPIQANVVTRVEGNEEAVTSGSRRAEIPHVTLAAGSIIGFTLVGSFGN